MENQLVWVDIPVINLDRAIKFYSSVLGETVAKEEYPGMTIGLLPCRETGVSGCLYTSGTDKPSDHGPLIYLGCDGRLDKSVEAVVPGGGKVLKEKHAIGPHGFRAIILDSEGNRIALHSH